MSENANPEPPAGDTAVAAVVDEAPAPAKKTKRKPPLRLRDMQSAGQSGGWMWIEKDAIDRLLLGTGRPSRAAWSSPPTPRCAAFPATAATRRA